MRATIVLAGLLLSACATIINGPRQEVDFRTAPAGASVLADGKEICKTPCTAKLTRSDEHVIDLQISGYYPYHLTMRNHGSNWILGDIFTGLAFMFVDLATGSCWYLTPEQVDRTLEPLMAHAPDDGRVRVGVALQPEIPR